MRDWVVDQLLPGYFAYTLPLPDEPTYALEPGGSLVATMVRRHSPRHRRAVLYVHGWSEYFFQSHLGDAFDRFGYDFYAVDLRRYGRSLREGQLAGFIPDMHDYRVELDHAVELIQEQGYESLVLAAHSTGGLVASLYANEHPGVFSALVLNSPWIELQGSPIRRASMHPIMRTVSALSPTTVLPMAVNDHYVRSLDANDQGEWHFDHNLKGDKAFLIRVGWLRAVMSGHAEVARGLSIDVPVLVLTSKRSIVVLGNAPWTDEIHHADAVLDVERIAERAPALGDHVTLVRLEGARHDVILSLPPVRDRAFAEIERFLKAYA
ncbi:alpha/beta hydrolase [Tessaracoccus sp. OH4464_COT-324]|uniref:alpha/beta hydrolase n=1 Tax=Tessaracoccus sp. OH4464_COT-324 TaxID=2491059 RepID=UPI000F63F0EA|nr:alpha/beta hydrolase [Tessaracoccus sp. OH4464_COT-324]RRD46945.1 alpha/beta hydrolase [Tessaracoccus sp. OH4464_COT-324]